MNTTVVFPRAKPEYVLGDEFTLVADIDLYTADEAVYTQKLITEYCEQQSRAPAGLRTYFELDDRRIDYQRQYGLRYSFHNYTNTDIVIVDRLGLPVTIKPERRTPAQRGVLIIRREMYFDNQDIAQRAYHNVQSLGSLQGADLSRIMPMLGLERPDHRFGRCLSLEYSITEEDIRKSDGRLYHLPTDMVVSFLTAADTIRHPCSPEYTQQQMQNDAKPPQYAPNHPVGALDVRVAFRYVCPDSKASAKYLRIGAHVFMLHPEKDEPAKLVLAQQGKEKTEVPVEISEYVEMIYPAYMDATREGVKGYRIHRVSMDQARQMLDIYDTLDDARNPIMAGEREKRQHKEELATQAAKFLDKERSFQIEISTLNDDRRRDKLTIDELRRARDVEIERLRAQNEEQQHKRKMSTESIKLIAGLAAACATVAGVYLKIKSDAEKSK